MRTFGGYVWADSPLHRAPAAAKLVGLVVGAALVLAVRGPITLAAALVAGLACTAIPGAVAAVPSAAAQATAPEDSAADPSGIAGADVPDVLRVRDTSGCPYRVSPPEPVTETEAPKPGESAGVLPKFDHGSVQTEIVS